MRKETDTPPSVVIRSRREGMGLSQKDLATLVRAAGHRKPLHRNTVSRVESGEYDADPSAAPSVAMLIDALNREETRRKGGSGATTSSGEVTADTSSLRAVVQDADRQGKPLPIEYYRFIELKSKLTPDQLDRVNRLYARTYKALAPIQDAFDREMSTVVIVLSYIEEDGLHGEDPKE